MSGVMREEGLAALDEMMAVYYQRSKHDPEFDREIHDKVLAWVNSLPQPPEPGESCRICDEWLDKATCPHCGSEYLICVNCDRVQNKWPD